jgi:site-specific recombinase XerD
MAREKNPYLKQFDQVIWDEKVLKENKDLTKDFINYCKSVDRSPETIKQYEFTLKGLFCYVYKELNNKSFTKFSKRDVMNMQNYWLNDIGLSSSRIRFIKSTMSSLSNFIESVLDEDYPDFRNIINKIPAPTSNKVMDKTIMKEDDISSLLNKLVEKGYIQQAFYISILYSSGMRKSESLRLNLDWFNDSNIIYGCLWKTPQTIRTKGKGKNGKQIVKYFFIPKLKPYLELWLKERERLNINIPDMFVVKDGDSWKPATKSTIESWIKTIKRVYGGRYYNHLNRHALCSELIRNGIPADVVKDLFGWESVDMVTLYNDNNKEDSFKDFFGENGIKIKEKTGLNDIK